MSKAQGQFTIIDYNDALTLTGYIGSNLAKTQMYNPDNDSYHTGNLFQAKYGGYITALSKHLLGNARGVFMLFKPGHTALHPP